jgi:hypothetical protein
MERRKPPDSMEREDDALEHDGGGEPGDVARHLPDQPTDRDLPDVDVDVDIDVHDAHHHDPSDYDGVLLGHHDNDHRQ